LPQRYEKEIIQTNNLAKIEKIQRNKLPKIKKIQRNITYVPSMAGYFSR
jgi:ribosomal protein S19